MCNSVRKASKYATRSGLSRANKNRTSSLPTAFASNASRAPLSKFNRCTSYAALYLQFNVHQAHGSHTLTVERRVDADQLTAAVEHFEEDELGETIEHAVTDANEAASPAAPPETDESNSDE